MMAPMEEESIVLLQTVALGGIGLFSLMWVNAFFIRRIALQYEVRARVSLARGQYNRVFLRFYLAVTYLAFAQLAAIVMWGVALQTLGIVGDPVRAIVFAGSCYTTVGIVSDILPRGWQLLPIFIAMSGLFSFSLSTMTMLNMAPLSRQAWIAKHARRIRAILAAHKVDLRDFALSGDGTTGGAPGSS